MNIAIITTALSENYGAALQTYALEYAIKNVGHNAVVYNYIDKRRITYGLSLKRKIIHKVWGLLRIVLSLGLKKKRFSEFRNRNITFTNEKYRTNDQLVTNPGIYDVYVSGSDQIWNPDLFLYDYSYFLNFVNGRKISYGSSFGRAKFTDEQLSNCKEMLNDFESISVRETSGITILRTLFDLEATVVLDPTLLLDRNDWNQIIPLKRKIRDPYILCYIMPGDSLVTDSIEKIAQYIAKVKNMRIIRLGLKEYSIFKYGLKGCNITAGPTDFLQYIRDAEYVITNSFHGTAFSLNFSKKAFIPINMNINEENCLHDRIVSLVRLLGADEMLVPIKENLPDFNEMMSKKVDMDKVDYLLCNERNRSMSYLEKAIRGNGI